ncbi:MAG TPA: carbon-nitrogen hydrolase family protein [Terriglobales bacterium]|nr:carbon-nitrogen hydrolase family protein [Terriglobales bacterium]
MSLFSIAALQLALPYGDNRDRLEKETARVVERFPWVRMVLFPELCSFGSALSFAEPLPGPTESRYQALARKHDIWLIPGSIYERVGNDIFNTASVINPQGEVVVRYRKIYPFLPYEKGVKSGNEFVVFDVPEIGRFGVSICYDGWFPETTRAMAWNGAEVILHPTMTTTIDRPQELILAQANAIANQCYFIDVNNVGQLGNGRSIVVGPEGEIIHQAGEMEEHIPVTVDLNRVREVRKNGTLRLGQVLKSFRDTDIDFPSYGGTIQGSPAMQSLGSMKIPEK